MLNIEAKEEMPWGVILPNSLFKQFWDACTFWATIYYIYSIPFRLSFTVDHVTINSLIPDMCIDMFFMIDIYAHLKHFAIIQDGFLINTQTEFQKIYVQGDFYVDVISTLPVSYLLLITGTGPKLFTLVRLLQCLRIRHFVRYLNSLVDILNAKNISNISVGQVRIIQMFFLVLVLSHWFACIFHLLGFLNEESGWLVADDLQDKDNISKYLRSLYWSFYTCMFTYF